MRTRSSSLHNKAPAEQTEFDCMVADLPTATRRHRPRRGHRSVVHASVDSPRESVANHGPHLVLGGALPIHSLRLETLEPQKFRHSELPPMLEAPIAQAVAARPGDCAQRVSAHGWACCADVNNASVRLHRAVLDFRFLQHLGQTDLHICLRGLALRRHGVCCVSGELWERSKMLLSEGHATGPGHSNGTFLPKRRMHTM